MNPNQQPREPQRPAGFSLQPAVPVLLFLAVNRVAGLRWAVVAATAWSVKIVVQRRRQGIPLGKFMPLITAAVLLRGLIGAITGSEAVYFGLGIASKYVAAAVLLGSVVLRTPLAGRAAPFVMKMPAGLAQNRIFRSTMAAVTVIAALYYLTSASFDIWLFRRSSVEGFVLVRFLANWPLSAVAIIAAATLTQRRLSQIPGLAPVTTLVEERMTALMPAPNSADSARNSAGESEIP